MRALAFVLLIAAPAALAAPVPKELRKSDLHRLAGTWANTGSCTGGVVIAPPDGSNWRFDTEGKAAILNAGQPPKEGIRFVLDSTTEPKSFDWIAPWGSWYGVYELKDNTFTIYLNSLGIEKRNRQAAVGPGVQMYSFKRSEPGK